YEQFPEYSDLAQQPGRDRLAVHHVLSMTLGLEWDELTITYGDPRNSDSAMEAAADRFRFLLERPVVGEPGVKWTYCSGPTALLATAITGTSARSSPAHRRGRIIGWAASAGAANTCSSCPRSISSWS